jgi:hypothetical protein
METNLKVLITGGTGFIERVNGAGADFRVVGARCASLRRIPSATPISSSISPAPPPHRCQADPIHTRLTNVLGRRNLGTRRRLRRTYFGFHQ